MIKNVKADLITPVIYSQFGIIALSPSTAIKVIIIDWIADFVLLLIVLFLIKFNIKKEFKKILLASFIGLVGGLLADILGIFGSMFDFFVIPIFMFTISFASLYGVYYLISKHLLKVDKKKIKTVAIFMAIFTNPLWLTLINASLFYPDYFVSPKQRFIAEQECRARFMQWCHQCLVSGWSDDITIPLEILPCMQEYNPLNMLLTKDSTCRYVKPICNYYGVE